ncbi:hypothetical protein TNCV_738271 [Trichonephila clavipes]|nr:hypothetical protein TNCV_738271 [Trichonephila clavipes]
MHIKHVEVKSPHVGVMWKFGRGVISSELLEACGENTQPYWAVARRVKAFRSSQKETADLQRTGGPSIPQDQIDILNGLLFIDNHSIVQKLSLEHFDATEEMWARAFEPELKHQSNEWHY